MGFLSTCLCLIGESEPLGDRSVYVFVETLVLWDKAPDTLVVFLSWK